MARELRVTLPHSTYVSLHGQVRSSARSQEKLGQRSAAQPEATVLFTA